MNTNELIVYQSSHLLKRKISTNVFKFWNIKNKDDLPTTEEDFQNLKLDLETHINDLKLKRYDLSKLEYIVHVSKDLKQFNEFIDLI